MGYRILFTVGTMCFAAVVASQTPIDASAWSEDTVPPPPRFSTDQLVPIDMPPYVTLRVGIDPETLFVGTDGVVRYVVVMRNSTGSEQAAYEGILCTKGEVKTYARFGAMGKWTAVEQPQWRPMTDNLGSRHAYAIAQQGGCDSRLARHRDNILQALKRRQQGNS